MLKSLSGEARQGLYGVWFGLIFFHFLVFVSFDGWLRWLLQLSTKLNLLLIRSGLSCVAVVPDQGR